MKDIFFIMSALKNILYMHNIFPDRWSLYNEYSFDDFCNGLSVRPGEEISDVEWKLHKRPVNRKGLTHLRNGPDILTSHKRKNGNGLLF